MTTKPWLVKHSPRAWVIRCRAVLRDARDPLGTQLSRRGRRQLATVGFIPGRPNPVRLLLEAHHIDPSQLAAQLSG